jgi:hypothetical protein
MEATLAAYVARAPAVLYRIAQRHATPGHAGESRAKQRELLLGLSGQAASVSWHYSRTA